MQNGTKAYEIISYPIKKAVRHFVEVVVVVAAAAAAGTTMSRGAAGLVNISIKSNKRCVLFRTKILVRGSKREMLYTGDVQQIRRRCLRIGKNIVKTKKKGQILSLSSCDG